MKMIGANTVVLMFIATIWLFCRHSRKLKVSHQSVHSSDADVNAIVTLKDICDFVSTKSFIVIGVNLKNKPCNFLVFFGSVCRFGVKVLVVGASVNTKNLTKNFNVMLEAKFMNRF